MKRDLQTSPRKNGLVSVFDKLTQGLASVDHILRQRSFESTEGNVAKLDDTTAHPTKEATSTETAGGKLVLPIRRVAAIVLIFGPIYGFAMGSYAFVLGKRNLVEQLPQMFYSGVKMPLLILITVAVSLPSFFVINTLLGLRDDFRDALRAIVSAQAGLMVILFSLFPLTLFSYVSLASSEVSYELAILFNAAMFGLASVSAQILLQNYYKQLVKRDPRHRWMVRMWIFVYAFVGIQAGYILRPFIGSPETPISFLRKESFQNAYVKIFELVYRVFESLQ